jgi:hypothetical protein
MQDPSLTPAPAVNVATRHFGDAIWPWFLGAVALGGLALLVWKLTSSKPDVVPDAAEGEADGDVESDGYASRWQEKAPRREMGKFKAALPVRLKYPPAGFKRRTRARSLSTRDYTESDGGRYNLEVED